MKIAIKNPAPIGKNQTKWGDYHFGNSLARAFRDRGVVVVQDYWPDWGVDHGEDVVLVLRGKRSFSPSGRRRKSVLWIISHPGTVNRDEMEAFDLVLVGSGTHHAMVSASSSIVTHVLRQCTDITTSPIPVLDDIRRRRGIKFVANSRGVRRDMVSWAVDAGVPFKIIGRHWGALGLKQYVESEYVDNDQLSACYGNTRLSLNDHWVDMRHFGYINNRIFDCLAAGSPILSDCFSELQEVCGDAILYARDATSFKDAIRSYHFGYPEIHGKTRELWRREASNYSFNARAGQIIDLVERTEARPPRLRVMEPVGARDCEFILGIAAQRLNHGPSTALQVLHLFPGSRNTAPLSSDDRLSYLSAGYGEGAWHVAITTEMREVLDSSFDMIIVDEHEQAANARDLLHLMKSVGRKLRPDGVCVISAGVSRLLNQARIFDARWIRSESQEVHEEPDDIAPSEGEFHHIETQGRPADR